MLLPVASNTSDVPPATAGASMLNCLKSRFKEAGTISICLKRTQALLRMSGVPCEVLMAGTGLGALEYNALPRSLTLSTTTVSVALQVALAAFLCRVMDPGT